MIDRLLQFECQRAQPQIRNYMPGIKFWQLLFKIFGRLYASLFRKPVGALFEVFLVLIATTQISGYFLAILFTGNSKVLLKILNRFFIIALKGIRLGKRTIDLSQA